MVPGQEVFRSAFWPFYLFALGLGLLLGISSILLDFGGTPKLPDLVSAAGVAALVGAALTAIAVRIFPVYISPSGLRSYTVWGWYRSVEWREIQRVGSLNLIGLHYLVIHTPHHRILIPKDLAQPETFRERVIVHAGSTNPLVGALRA